MPSSVRDVAVGRSDVEVGQSQIQRGRRTTECQVTFYAILEPDVQQLHSSTRPLQLRSETNDFRTQSANRSAQFRFV